MPPFQLFFPATFLSSPNLTFFPLRGLIWVFISVWTGFPQSHFSKALVFVQLLLLLQVLLSKGACCVNMLCYLLSVLLPLFQSLQAKPAAVHLLWGGQQWPGSLWDFQGPGKSYRTLHWLWSFHKIHCQRFVQDLFYYRGGLYVVLHNRYTLTLHAWDTCVRKVFWVSPWRDTIVLP